MDPLDVQPLCGELLDILGGHKSVVNLEELMYRGPNELSLGGLQAYNTESVQPPTFTALDYQDVLHEDPVFLGLFPQLQPDLWSSFLQGL